MVQVACCWGGHTTLHLVQQATSRFGVYGTLLVVNGLMGMLSVIGKRSSLSFRLPSFLSKNPLERKEGKQAGVEWYYKVTLAR